MKEYFFLGITSETIIWLEEGEHKRLNEDGGDRCYFEVAYKETGTIVLLMKVLFFKTRTFDETIPVLAHTFETQE